MNILCTKHEESAVKDAIIGLLMYHKELMYTFFSKSLIQLVAYNNCKSNIEFMAIGMFRICIKLLAIQPHAILKYQLASTKTIVHS